MTEPRTTHKPAALGAVVVGVGENTAVEVAHSAMASLTWLATATLFALSRTVRT